MVSLANGERARALIVGDAFARGGLAGARALKAAGWEVGVGTPQPGGPLAWSRAVSRRHDVPSPAQNQAPFVGAVAEAVAAGRYHCVFGTGDAEVITLSAHRDTLGAVFPYADHDVVVASFDKMQLYEGALAADLAPPVTVPLERRNELRFPYVLKPRMHEALGTTIRVEAEIVASESDAKAVIGRAATTRLVAQEMVPGTLMAFSVVRGRDGRTVARSQQVADAVYPLPAGVSARARTVLVDDDLADKVDRFLATLGWFGLAELQFIIDSGVPHLIDMNGRFYGSMALAVAAGANLPAAWADLAVGRDVAAVTAAPGFAYQWLEGDLRSALSESRSVRSVVATVSRSRGAAHSVWSVRDPGPAMRLAAHLARRASTKLLAKVGRR